MLTKIKSNIRGLVEDFAKSDFETFTYSNSAIFTLAEDNIDSITSVKKNGTPLGSEDYSWDSVNNELTITDSLSSGDIIIVKYTYYKYSDAEIEGHLENALHWLSIYDKDGEDYNLEDSGIYPTPDNKTAELLAIIASILIKPDYSEYRLPNLTVRYPRTMHKEERIQKLIMKFKGGIGLTNTLDWY